MAVVSLFLPVNKKKLSQSHNSYIQLQFVNLQEKKSLIVGLNVQLWDIKELSENFIIVISRYWQANQSMACILNNHDVHVFSWGDALLFYT